MEKLKTAVMLVVVTFLLTLAAHATNETAYLEPYPTSHCQVYGSGNNEGVILLGAWSGTVPNFVANNQEWPGGQPSPSGSQWSCVSYDQATGHIGIPGCFCFKTETDSGSVQMLNVYPYTIESPAFVKSGTCA